MESKGIVDVLHDIQVALKVPKNLWNDFGGYPYRNAESILQSAKPLLPDGYAIVCNSEPVEIGGKVFCKSIASLVSAENTISATGYSREPESKKGMDASQVSGSNNSYAKKYALGNLFAIDGMKDSDDPQVQAATEDSVEYVQPIPGETVTTIDVNREKVKERLWTVVAQYAEQQRLDPKKVAEDALRGRKLADWPTDELEQLADDFESQVV